MKNFLEKQKKVCSSKKNLGRVPHPQGRLWPQKFLKFSNFGQNHDFGLFWPQISLWGPFFHLFGATEPQNIVSSTKKFLEALWGIFGAGRIFSATPPHPTPIFGHRNFCTKKSQFWAKMGWWRNFCGRKYGLWVRGGRKIFGPHRKYPKVFPKKFLRYWPYFGALWSRKSEKWPKKGWF